MLHGILISIFDICIRYMFNFEMVHKRDARDQHLLSGLVRIHLLHHACEGPIFGLGMIEELRQHGYNLSAGTLYPMLHRLEQTGLLKSRAIQLKGRTRKVYRATSAGRKAMARARSRVKVLFQEILG
jgi:PadR family transcriptional regulator, regulatory protein PadR